MFSLSLWQKAGVRAVAACLALTAHAQSPERPAPLKSGLEFSSADVRSLQADDFANPELPTPAALLWKLFSTPLPQNICIS